MPTRRLLHGCTTAMMFAALTAAGSAIADEKPAAMVESLSGAVPGVAAMDYLAPGRSLALPDGATVVLDYLSTCTRETITGGQVVIGTEQSAVTHGHVARKQMECDGSELQLSAAQSDAGGVAVYRALGQPQKPTLILHGTMPLIAAHDTAPVRAQRLDVDEPAFDLGAPSASGGRATLDLAGTGHALVAGGVYRVTQGERVVVVKVDAGAQPGALPLMQRLLPI